MLAQWFQRSKYNCVKFYVAHTSDALILLKEVLSVLTVNAESQCCNDNYRERVEGILRKNNLRASNKEAVIPLEEGGTHQSLKRESSTYVHNPSPFHTVFLNEHSNPSLPHTDLSTPHLFFQSVELS